jgi:hypothetical protein
MKPFIIANLNLTKVVYIRKFWLIGYKKSTSGANPTTPNYSASIVKIYNATSSLVRFKNKNISSTLKYVVAYYNAGIVVVNSLLVGLATGVDFMKLFWSKFTDKTDFGPIYACNNAFCGFK